MRPAHFSLYLSNKPLPSLLAILALAMSGCGTKSTTELPPANTTSAAPSTTTGESNAAPTDAANVKLAIVDFNEINQRVAAHKGQVVVMDAWSTSCPPCMAEFHNLVDLHKKYGPQDLACVSLSFDFEGLGKPEEVQGGVLDFLRKKGATFENLMSNEESDTLYRKFQLAAVPAVFVYDRSGQLRKRFDNEKAKTKAEAFNYEQVGALVAELVKEPIPAAEATSTDSNDAGSAGQR